MPVILNEPLSALQRTAELYIAGEARYRQAAETDDSLYRLILTWVASIGGLYPVKYRKKKPFNAMLGETYELVTEHYRVFCEKVQHNPVQISCLQLEGHGYKVWAYDKPNLKFRLFGGRGMVEIEPLGLNDVYYHKYDEHISMSKPTILAKNIIFGGMFIDFSGTSVILNHKTGEKIVIQYLEKQSDRL